jgi:hypothetical protein
MMLGFNYPNSRDHFGYDLGPFPVVSRETWLAERTLALTGKAATIPLEQKGRLFEHLDRNLKNLHDMGFQVVRFFILGNGLNYGDPPTKGDKYDDDPKHVPYYDWRFTPPLQTDPRFKIHFEALLQSVKKAQLKVIPSIVSFEFGGNRGQLEYQAQVGDIGLAAGGRSDCFKAGTYLAFLNRIFSDLLTIAASPQYKDIVYAFEVINEPYFNTQPLLGQLGVRYPEVTFDEMNEFLFMACKTIEARGLPSTVGHRHFGDIYAWNAAPPTFWVSGSKPQFHYYGKVFVDPSQIEGQGLFQRQPKPFLGEFDSDFNRFGTPWPELGHNDTTFERLALLEREGCELALIWPDFGGTADEAQRIIEEDVIKLQARTRQAIVDFTGGTLPPANE